MAEPTTAPKYMRLLDPEALSKIGRLELLARGVVEGFVAGRHRSPYRGFSVEFADHREYVPGDDPDDLDWRVYAKSDRYYIKRYIEETNLRSIILLDASGSMKYTGDQAARRNGKRLSKFEYGQYLAASLAHLMIHQQDAVGLVTFDTRVRRYIPARSRSSHLRSILEELDKTEPGAETALPPIFHDIAERIHRRGLIIIISDLFDDPEQMINALHHFRYRKHEVIVLHVMAEEEFSFPFDRWSLFRDLEVAGQKVQLDPRSIRAAYLDEIQKFIGRLERGCGQMNVDYVPMTTRRDFDVALTTYLARRRSLTK
ncbi:MAG TPA: DUF58 domain-containing protein [Planctomycetota bacterium]|nr:DUF58 domain-containing protein [Planctomycetota bacterium]HRR79599.1 DUF58 domain-containing protein [Planctomycetota bacterium]HRT95024.1 DUF58 domain-containing protein [Planctomycetota bacterium]